VCYYFDMKKIFLSNQFPKTIQYVVGIDEVGRGPLAGPVTIGVFMIPVSVYKGGDRKRDYLPEGITDSKKLSAKKREELTSALRALRTRDLCSYTTVSQPASEIDRIGISKCIKKCIAQGLQRLKCDPQKTFIYLDGSLKAPEEFLHQETVIKGDSKIKVIGAASIVAKVWRDAYMTRLAQKYPEYGFEIHKGYGTKMHRGVIKKKGSIVFHRLSYLGNI